MDRIRRQIVLMTMVLVIVVSGVAPPAFAACNCADMSINTATDMPCHSTDAVDADQNIDNEKQSPECMKCGCGHCVVSSPALLNRQDPVAEFIVGTATHSSYSDIVVSLITFGIDNPPKRLS